MTKRTYIYIQVLLLSSRFHPLFCIFSFQFCKFIENHIIDNLYVSSFHAGRTRFDHARTLKLTKCIYNHGTGNSHAIRNSACNKNSLIDIQLIKDVGDCLKLRERKCADRRFYDCNLSRFLCTLFVYRTHHFQSYHRCSVLCQNNVINVIFRFAPVFK